MAPADRRHSVTKPLVSAIIPTRNRAYCLPRAIESVLAQEGLGEQFELETIVVDDASTDDTHDVVRRYPGVRYVHLPSQRGVSAALNAGLRASSGRFISFLGDDDEWLPHKLRKQVPLLASQTDAGVVYGQYAIRCRGREEVRPRAKRSQSGWVFLPMLVDSFCSHHAALLIRRQALEAVGGFDETLIAWEDNDVSLRLARHCQFVFAPGVVTVYNQAPSGLYLSSVANGAIARDAARVIETALQTLPDSERYAAVKQAARVRIELWAAWLPAKLGDTAAAQDRLLNALAKHPFAVHHEWGAYCVSRVAAERVFGGERPVTVVRDLHVRVKEATNGNRPALRWWASLLAELSLQRFRSRWRQPTEVSEGRRISGQACAGRALT